MPIHRFFFSIALILLLVGAPSVKAEVEVILSGNPSFDSDSICNGDANQWRWLSFPGSRLTLNPVPGKEVGEAARWEMPPMENDLRLKVGAYIGVKTIRQMNLMTVEILGEDGKPQPAKSVSTVWYPYQITFNAIFPQKNKISGCDFFPDANGTLLRKLVVNGPKGALLRLSGQLPARGSAKWVPSNKALLVGGPGYYYAMKFACLEGAVKSFSSLPEEPKITDDNWALELPVPQGAATFEIAIGLSPQEAGESKAIALAASACSVPCEIALSRCKKVMDEYLRRVPEPQQLGFTEGGDKITEQQHRRAYYAAWAFLLENILDALPENPAYQYPQLTVGKASLWDEGEKNSPGTSSWESLLGLQWLSFLEPDLAWKAFAGMMTLVDAEGKLDGESLPSRKAQTAWILYKAKPDRTRLEEVYPALKRYLLWREQNPRWIYGTNNITDEKDIEFVVSWLMDVDYAKKIAVELGIPGEDVFWNSRQVAMVGEMRGWFFDDNHNIEQLYFTDSRMHATKDRHEKVPSVISSVLGCKELPPDLVEQAKANFRSYYNLKQPLAGFKIGKYPDLNITAYGLLDRNMPEAEPYVKIFLRDSIKAGEFAECIKNGPIASGVKPSLFSPMTIIEFTWLLNHVRYESGTPTSFRPSNKSITKSN